MDIIQEFEKTKITRKFPNIKAGDTVKVHQKITEESSAKGKKGDKERVQVFEGVVLRVRGGKGMAGSFLVRKITSGVGVEKNFPIHMPSIVKVEVVKRGKVRRSRLYYLRDKKEKESRLQEIKLTKEELDSLKYEENTENPKKEKKAEDKKVKEKETKPEKKAKEEKKDKLEKKNEKTEEKKEKSKEDRKEAKK